MKQVIYFLFSSIIIGTIFVAIPVYSQCIYRGESVPEGTRVGDYVCREGRWVFEPL